MIFFECFFGLQVLATYILTSIDEFIMRCEDHVYTELAKEDPDKDREVDIEQGFVLI